MKVRWLGWAGVEIEADGAPLVIDPLEDPGATFAALGDGARDAHLPLGRRARGSGEAVAGLVSHLHRDHADSGALAAALAPERPSTSPSGPAVRPPRTSPWRRRTRNSNAPASRDGRSSNGRRLEVGPFAITPLPAVDGLGDPQVSWLVEAGGHRVLHLGDTIFHGYWWRMARRHGPFDLVFAPINGAVIDFPHLQPPSVLAAAMEPEQAALAGDLLGARTVVPMHYDGYGIDPWYRPIDDAAGRFRAAAAGRSYAARVLNPGDGLELADL